MTASRHDVCPWILLAMFGEDERAIAACLLYGVRYLSAWCSANDTPHTLAAIEAAAADGLAVLYRRRASMAADARACALRMRADRYRSLRGLAMRVYRLRLREACTLFHTGRIHTNGTPYLDTGRSSPLSKHHPRAPGHVTPGSSLPLAKDGKQ